MTALFHEADFWAPQRVRLRVLLELLEATAEADACPRPACPGLVDVRAALATLAGYIDSMPADCDCHPSSSG